MGGVCLYAAHDRPDTMFSSKTIMQHVSNPNELMEARLRLASYYAGKPVLVWCYELQDLPKVLRGDGDADWAGPQELLKRSI